MQLPAKDSKKARSARLGGMSSGFGVLGVALVVGLMVGSQMDVNDVEIAKGLRDAVTRVQSECVTGLRNLLVLAGWKAV